MTPFTLSSLLRSSLLLLSMFLFSSSVLASDWALSFGMPAQWARINASVVDDTGNTYIAGYFTNYTQPLGSTTLVRNGGGSDAFVAKINVDGTVLWARNYGGTTSSYLGNGAANTQATGIAVDASGNVYLSGDTVAPLTTPSVPGAAGPFVIKLDDAGTTLWAKVLGGTSVQNTKTTGIAVDGTGGVYLSGYSGNGTNPSILGETVRGVQDAFALKLDAADGTTIWAKNYGGSGATTRAHAIAVDTWGSVYLAGHFHSANLTTPALTRIGGADAFALKLDPSNGSPDWARNYGGSGAGAYANAIAVDASGNVYLGGNFDSANLTTPALSLIGTGDVFAFKLDSVGSVSGTGAWARNYGGSGAVATATGIAVDASGNVYLGGDFSSANLTTPALTKIGSTDAFALKLDSLGATTWARNYGGGGVDPWGYRVSANAFAIAVDASGNVHLGGSFDNGNLTSPALTFTPNGRTDALILKQTTVLPVVNSLSTASGGVSGGTVVTLSGYSLSGATAVNFGANPGTSLTVNSATSITVTVPASTTGFGAVDVTVTTPSGTGGTGNGLFTYVGAPSQLAAPTVTLTGNVATVSFTAPADNGSAITGYTVSTSPAGGIDLEAGTTATSHHIVGLAAGTAYTFSVTAANGIGSSSASASVSTPSSFAASSFGSSGSLTHITATAVDAAGNTYIAGDFAGASLTLGGTTLTRIGAKDAFAAKIDTTGSVLWAKNFGDSGLTYAGDGVSAVANAIAVDSAGNVYLAGDTDHSLTTPALGTASAWGASFALKLDAGGATVWAQTFYGAATVHAQSIAVDASGRVYLGGYFGDGSGTSTLTTPALTGIGNYDAFAFKLNADGSTAWAKNFGGSGASAIGNAIAVDTSGNVYLGGYFYGFSNSLSTPALTRIGARDAFALKLDASGTTLWAKNYGGSGAISQAYGIAVDGRGNVYLGGFFESTNLSTPALTKIGTRDAFALKLDTGGVTVWAQNYGGSGMQAMATALAVDTAGNVALGGYFEAGQGSSATNLTTPALTLLGNSDAFAFKLDASGTVAWAKNYGGSGASASALAMDASGNVYLGGFFSGNLTTPALTAVGSQDAFFLRSATSPGAPTGISASAGDTQATVSFSAPASNGGSAITGYTVVSSPTGGVDSHAGNTALSHTITGLTNGISYTFTVTATNAAGTGPVSTASNAVTLAAPQPDPGPPAVDPAPPAPTEVPVSGPGQSVTAVPGLPVRIAAGANVEGATIDFPANAPITVELGGSRFTVSAQTNGTQLALTRVVVNGQPVLALVLRTGSARIVAGGVGETLLVLGDGTTPVVAGTANTEVDVRREGTSTLLSVGSGFVVLSPGTQRAQTRALSTANTASAEYRVYVGERATLDAAGRVSAHVLGGGTVNSAGDALSLSWPSNLSLVSSVPQLDARSERLGKSVLQAIADTVGATQVASQSQGVLTLDDQGYSLRLLPLGTVNIDPTRADGVTLGADGMATVTVRGVQVRLAPSVGDLGGLARDVAAVLPGATLKIGATGVIVLTTAQGVHHALRSGWFTQMATTQPASFAVDADGRLGYVKDFLAFTLHPAFVDFAALAAAVERSLPGAALQTNPDGTVTVVSGTQRWTLMPQMQLNAAPGEVRQWWVEADGSLRLRNADGTLQSFRVQ